MALNELEVKDRKVSSEVKWGNLRHDAHLALYQEA